MKLWMGSLPELPGQLSRGVQSKAGYLQVRQAMRVGEFRVQRVGGGRGGKATVAIRATAFWNRLNYFQWLSSPVTNPSPAHQQGRSWLSTHFSVGVSPTMSPTASQVLVCGSNVWYLQYRAAHRSDWVEHRETNKHVFTAGGHMHAWVWTTVAPSYRHTFVDFGKGCHLLDSRHQYHRGHRCTRQVHSQSQVVPRLMCEGGS
jgi:hypothetical protein